MIIEELEQCHPKTLAEYLGARVNRVLDQAVGRLGLQLKVRVSFLRRIIVQWLTPPRLYTNEERKRGPKTQAHEGVPKTIRLHVSAILSMLSQLLDTEQEGSAQHNLGGATLGAVECRVSQDFTGYSHVRTPVAHGIGGVT